MERFWSVVGVLCVQWRNGGVSVLVGSGAKGEESQDRVRRIKSLTDFDGPYKDSITQSVSMDESHMIVQIKRYSQGN